MTVDPGSAVTATCAAWVSLPHATFALVIRDGIVVDAPPIVRRSIGRPALAVLDYYRRRGASICSC